MTQYLPGFPKQMMHPQFRASVMKSEATGFTDNTHGPTITGSAMMFPPETAETPDAEERLRARGYVMAGETSSVTTYQEYPLMMVHPEHEDAVPDRIEAQSVNGAIQTFTITGTPEKYPHQFVNTPEEEQAWAAKGYARPGVADDRAFDRATEAPGMPGADWPKWVDGVLMQDPDNPVPQPDLWPMWVSPPGREDKVIVNSAVEYAKVMGHPYAGEAKPVAPPEPDGDEMAEFRAWKAAQAVVPAPAVAVPAQADDALAGLRRQADEAGIAYDKRWGAKRLAQAIEGAKAA